MLRFTASAIVDVSAHTTVGSATVKLPATGGRLVRAWHTVPDLTGAAAITATVKLKDSDGRTLYEKGSLAENATTEDDLLTSGGSGTAIFAPTGTDMLPTLTYEVTLSGAESVDRTVSSVFYLEVS